MNCLNPVFGRVLFVIVLSLGMAQVSGAEKLYKVTADGAEPFESSSAKVLPAPDEVLTTDTIEFSIRYDDVNTGFMDPSQGATRRAIFHNALEYVSEALGRSGKIDVQVDASQSDGTGFLATAGSFFSVATGFQKASSLRRLESPTSVKPFANFEEINMEVDFGHNWHYGLDAPPSGTVDFLSTMVHELTHGMGFVSLVASDGSSLIGPNIYSFYDQFLGNRSSGALFFDANANLHVTGATLNSNVMGYVNSTSTTVYDNGGLRIPIFSPNPFQSGSSFGHVDVGTVAGNPVMTHVINTGAMTRLYSTADLGILRVIGYPSAIVEPGTLSFVPLPNSPPSPFTLTSVTSLCNGTNAQNRLTWTPSSGATSYVVFRNNVAIYSGLTGTTFDNNNVTAGITYTYKVRANNAFGSTFTSNQISHLTGTCPGAFTLSSVTSVCNGENPQNILTWTPSSGATSYAIFRNGVAIVSGLTGTTFTNNSVVEGTTYTYKVRANNAIGNTFSNTVSRLTSTCPSFSLNVTTAPCNGSSPQNTLTWESSPGAISYTIYRDGVAVRSGLTGTTLTTSNVTPGVTHTYYIRAINATGNTNSNTVSKLTGTCP